MPFANKKFFSQNLTHVTKGLFFHGITNVNYNDLNIYCRELAPRTVSLTGDRAQGDDSKQCASVRIISNNK